MVSGVGSGSEVHLLPSMHEALDSMFSILQKEKEKQNPPKQKIEGTWSLFWGAYSSAKT